MEKRVFVGNRLDSIAFFNDVKNGGNFHSFKELCTILRIPHGRFWFLQTGRRSLTITQFKKLFSYLPPELQKRYYKIIDIRPRNWGQIIGGKIAYEKIKDAFEKGRTKACEARSRKAESKFNILQTLNSDICEYLGAFAGDGFTNDNNSNYTIGFSGDSRYDFDYYLNTIIPISEKYFNLTHHHTRIDKNSMWISFYSKALFKMLTERFDMPKGEKWDKVLVPKEIMRSNIEHKTAFLRGTFDSDGCVSFDRRPIYKEPYMRVDITMVNTPILKQLNQILTELGINSSVLGNGKHLQICSKENVRKFFEIVGTSNKRHRTKVRQKYKNFEEWNPARFSYPVS
ncbi:MAG: LAGLIDADG family homing endonuclease [Candidatus Diapherotrites archaeon]|nr:LAGLIDADG family homing endonuclease [Candidatus Diapherotrites archaeon]